MPGMTLDMSSVSSASCETSWFQALSLGKTLHPACIVPGPGSPPVELVLLVDPVDPLDVVPLDDPPLLDAEAPLLLAPAPSVDESPHDVTIAIAAATSPAPRPRPIRIARSYQAPGCREAGDSLFMHGGETWMRRSFGRVRVASS